MKKADFILIAVVLLASLGFLGFRYLTRTEGGSVVVTVDGKETARFSLSEDREEDLAGAGGTNHLVIRGGKASVTDADCPDRLCVHEADIQYNKETIVCLPHKLIVKIESGEEAEVDDVAR